MENMEMENSDTDVPVKDKEIKVKSKPDKTRILTIRLGQKEGDMVDALKSSPYFLNMSEFLRESIRRYYDKRVNRTGNTQGTQDS